MTMIKLYIRVARLPSCLLLLPSLAGDLQCGAASLTGRRQLIEPAHFPMSHQRMRTGLRPDACPGQVKHCSTYARTPVRLPDTCALVASDGLSCSGVIDKCCLPSLGKIFILRSYL